MRWVKLQKREEYYPIDSSEKFHYRKIVTMISIDSFVGLLSREFGATTLFLQREDRAISRSWIASISRSVYIVQHEEYLFWNPDHRNSGRSFPRFVGRVNLDFHIEVLEIDPDHGD